MPIRWDVDPGGEWLIPFAKKKLAQLKAQFADIGIDNLQRWYQVDESTRVGVASMAGFDRITVRAGNRHVWVQAMPLTDNNPRFFVSRALSGVTYVGPKVAPCYQLADGSSALGEGGPVTFRTARNRTEEVMLTIAEDGAGGSSLWFGWLTKHRAGGWFTRADTRSSASFTRMLLSASGTRLLIRGTPSGETVSIEKVDVIFATDDEGVITATPTYTMLLDGPILGEFTFESSMYFKRDQSIGYVQAGSGIEEAVFSLDVGAGAWTKLYSFPALSFHSAFLRVDESGSVWFVTVSQEGYNTVNVYRGSNLVHTITDLSDGGTVPAVLIDDVHGVSSSGDTIAFAIRHPTMTGDGGFAVKLVVIHNGVVDVSDVPYSGYGWFFRAPIVPAVGGMAFYQPADPSLTVDGLRPRVVVFDADGAAQTHIVTSAVAAAVSPETNYMIAGASVQWYGVCSGFDAGGDFYQNVRLHKVDLVPESDGVAAYWEHTVVVERTVGQLGGRFIEPAAYTQHWVL